VGKGWPREKESGLITQPKPKNNQKQQLLSEKRGRPTTGTAFLKSGERTDVRKTQKEKNVASSKFLERQMISWRGNSQNTAEKRLVSRKLREGEGYRTSGTQTF